LKKQNTRSKKRKEKHLLSHSSTAKTKTSKEKELFITPSFQKNRHLLMHSSAAETKELFIIVSLGKTKHKIKKRPTFPHPFFRCEMKLENQKD
jgi:hypothetical protein